VRPDRLETEVVHEDVDEEVNNGTNDQDPPDLFEGHMPIGVCQGRYDVVHVDKQIGIESTLKDYVEREKDIEVSAMVSVPDERGICIDHKIQIIDNVIELILDLKDLDQTHLLIVILLLLLLLLLHLFLIFQFKPGVGFAVSHSYTFEIFNSIYRAGKSRRGT
jgi:hypothetical protein